MPDASRLTVTCLEVVVGINRRARRRTARGRHPLRASRLRACFAVTRVCRKASRNQRPAACSGPGSVVDRVARFASRIAEDGANQRREQHPCDRQVIRGISAVKSRKNYCRETSVANKQIAWMEIPVDPQRRPRPIRRLHQLIPQGEYRRPIDQSLELCRSVVHTLCTICELSAAHRVRRSIMRGRFVQRTHKQSEVHGGGAKIIRRRHRRCRPDQPGAAPGPGKPLPGRPTRRAQTVRVDAAPARAATVRVQSAAPHAGRESAQKVVASR